VCDSALVFDWNDLRYLLAIARTGTLTSAARELGVEHTTVGRRLAALEHALGTRLFTRSPSGFTPTGAAREILPIAEEIAARIESIERRVSGEDARIEGTVRVTASEAISGYLVKNFVALRERHPQLMVEILSGNRSFDVMRGEADIAVRAREVEEPGLVVRKLVEAGWSLYAAPAYVERKGAPATPEDLCGHDVIGFDKSMGAVPGALWLDEHAQGTQVVMRGNSIVAALNAAILGLGMTVLPCFIADTESALRRLTARVLGGRNIFLVVHPDLAKVAKVRTVMEFIVHTFERDARMWRGED
jgi:DNA-binding transcriptional LysR family regulator